MVVSSAHVQGACLSVMSVTQSRLSANDKGDNEAKPGAVHRSPGIYLIAEENPEKSQLGDRLVKAVQPLIASK